MIFSAVFYYYYLISGAEVAVSHDAGRFVCNYLLFRSLQRSRAAGPRMHSLFVHVPCSRFIGHAQKMLEVCTPASHSLSRPSFAASCSALSTRDIWSPATTFITAVEVTQGSVHSDIKPTVQTAEKQKLLSLGASAVPIYRAHKPSHAACTASQVTPLSLCGSWQAS